MTQKENQSEQVADPSRHSDREIQNARGIRIAGAGFLLVFLSGGLTFIGSGFWAEIGTGIGFVLVAAGMILVLRNRRE